MHQKHVCLVKQPKEHHNTPRLEPPTHIYAHSPRVDNLAADLWADGRMRVRAQQLQQGFLLLGGNVLLVPAQSGKGKNTSEWNTKMQSGVRNSIPYKRTHLTNIALHITRIATNTQKQHTFTTHIPNHTLNSHPTHHTLTHHPSTYPHIYIHIHIHNAPLHKDEEGLVPEHRQLAGVVGEAMEVEDEGVDDAIGQRILLVEQHAQNDAAGACVEWKKEEEGEHV